MWLVRLGTFSRYGHAAEVVATRGARPDAPRAADEVLIVEAAPGGVRQRWCPPDEFRWSTGGPLDVHLTPAVRTALVKRSYSVLNKGYDWPSLTRFVPRFFYSKFTGFTTDHPDARLFCSELVVWNRRAQGIDMFPGTAPRDVSPGMLQDFCPPSPAGKP